MRLFCFLPVRSRQVHDRERCTRRSSFASRVLVHQPRVQTGFFTAAVASWRTRFRRISARLSAAHHVSPSAGYRPPTIRSIVIPRVGCEPTTRSRDPIRDRRGPRHGVPGSRSFLSFLVRTVSPFSPLEGALTTVARIDLVPSSLLFSSPTRRYSHVHQGLRKVFVRLLGASAWNWEVERTRLFWIASFFLAAHFAGEASIKRLLCNSSCRGARTKGNRVEID